MRKVLALTCLLIATPALAQQATVIGPVGSGTVNAGTTGDGAYYSTSTNVVSDAGSASGVKFGGLSTKTITASAGTVATSSGQNLGYALNATATAPSTLAATSYHVAFLGNTDNGAQVTVNNANVAYIENNFGGASLTGNRGGLAVANTMTATTGNSSLTGNYYSALDAYGYATANDNGTGVTVSTAVGHNLGANIIAYLSNSAATNWWENSGLEVDNEIVTGASAYKKVGVSAVSLSADAVSGAVVDGAFLVGAQTGAVGWKTGLLFDGLSGSAQWPITSTGTIMGSNVAGTAANGLDFHLNTFTSHELYFPGFSVDGSGNITGNTLITAISPGASQSAITVPNAPYSGGTGTTNFPLVYINDGAAPTNFSTAGTEFGINTPNGFSGNAIDIHNNGGNSIFEVTGSTGAVIINNATGIFRAGGRTTSAWTTSGQAFIESAATWIDSSSSGTIAAEYISLFGTPTLAFSNATTVTNAYNTYFQAPVAGTDATLTNKYALGADSINVTGAAVNLTGIGVSTAADVLCYASSTGLVTYEPTGTTCTVSARRFKTDINYLSDAHMLNEILGMKPVSFRFKPGVDDNGGEVHYGLIAEDVARVAPELVAYEKDGQTHGVKYGDGELQSHLIGAIKAEQAEIDALRNERSCRSIYIRGLMCW